MGIIIFQIEDSDDESNEENPGTLMCCENDINVMTAEREMASENHNPIKMETITSSMKNMSLKGEQKKVIISLMVKTPGPVLNAENLRDIVKPSFRSLFTNNTSESSDIGELLDRFNCLPNSVGQLLENLDKIGRFDVKMKILEVL